LGLTAGRYFLVTMHRAENVDVEARLRNLIQALVRLAEEFGFPAICSLHPRTRAKLDAFGIGRQHSGIQFVAPFGFFDFVHLERSAYCVLSDSGTVQEEACILGVPNVTLRDVTERPETVECGSYILSGVEGCAIATAVRLVTSQSGAWQPPPEYVQPAVAETVCRIVLG